MTKIPVGFTAGWKNTGNFMLRVGTFVTRARFADATSTNHCTMRLLTDWLTQLVHEARAPPPHCVSSGPTERQRVEGKVPLVGEPWRGGKALRTEAGGIANRRGADFNYNSSLSCGDTRSEVIHCRTRCKDTT